MYQVQHNMLWKLHASGCACPSPKEITVHPLKSNNDQINITIAKELATYEPLCVVSGHGKQLVI